MRNLTEGCRGCDVEAIQNALKDRGFSPGAIDGHFGAATVAAVLAFQRSDGLVVDAIVGAKTFAALGIASRPPGIDATRLTPAAVARLFPETPLFELERNYDLLRKALRACDIDNHHTVLTALGTIRAETQAFRPSDEFVSHLNTSPNGEPFDLYDWRQDLGNQGPDDGQRFRGRGFVRLTGRAHYARMSYALGLPELVTDPAIANLPEVAGRILARHLKEHEEAVARALHARDLAAVRRVLGGDSSGLDAFARTYFFAEQLAAAVLS
jgi:peptidoglycan L-alanyl-D-glutamate endopeptidase CwlK